MINVQKKCKNTRAQAMGKTPQIKDHGQFIMIDSQAIENGSKTLDLTDDNAVVFSYMVMPKYGSTLQDLFEEKEGQFSAASIYSLGIQVLTILEQMHQAGYIFNDLKLDNLLFDSGVDTNDLKAAKGNIFDKQNINIIDFGFVSPYLDKDTQEHLEKTQLDCFRGNITFASLNQMKFHSTSRRDDLISLFYLMVYMLKRGNLPGLNIKDDTDVNEEFKIVRDAKQNQTSKDLCYGNTQDLKAFKREVFSYRYKDEPNYEQLRDMLR